MPSPERQDSSASLLPEASSELTVTVWGEKYDQYLDIYQTDPVAAEKMITPFLATFQTPPTETARYTDTFAGISFDLPYNPAWGGDTPIAPYWMDDVLKFGRLGGMEGGIGRYCSFSVREKRDLQEAVEENMNSHCDSSVSDCSLEEGRNLGISTVGKNQMVIAHDASFGTTSAEVAGPSYNYYFWCWDDLLEGMLPSIVVE